MATTTQQSGTLYNALTAGSKIIGTIIADSDIRIDGRVEGDMQCSGKVVIGEKGSVKGSIACQNAEIMGLLDGKISVQQTLALRASGKIEGDVRTQTLIVEPNAVFNGTCSMGKKSDSNATNNNK
ncbi:MAG: polymer-forming cytoskeletal protein [Paludibacteraceae bacterium]|jgi:cytoskeletal protein CcmA (bactofilin family)|nr:polymer-forming cytoskeletal protein [Paludibacteraceae bacterium]